MSSYRLINFGKVQRREYFSKNRSPLFQLLPEYDFAQEQKESYESFLNKDLKKLLNFYFPDGGRKIENYNNQVLINIEDLKREEPEIEEERARADFKTWEYTISFTWKIAWNFKKIPTRLLENDWQKSIEQWVESSFEIKQFVVKPLKKKPPKWDSYWEEENSAESYWEVKEVEGSLKGFGWGLD